MSIQLTDGPTLLRCDFTRNVTESIPPGTPVKINISHESATTISEDIKEAQVIYTVQSDKENSLFVFQIEFGVKFKIEGFKKHKEAHSKVTPKAMLILQVAVRDFLADLTRRAGKQPLVIPLPELEKGPERLTKNAREEAKKIAHKTY